MHLNRIVQYFEKKIQLFKQTNLQIYGHKLQSEKSFINFFIIFVITKVEQSVSINF